MFILAIRQFYRLDSGDQLCFTDVLAHGFEDRDDHFEVLSVELRLETAADGETNFGEKVLALLEPLVPQLRGGGERKNVRKDSEDPLEQKHCRLELDRLKSPKRHRHVRAEQPHEAVEKFVDCVHVKAVESVQHLLVHKVGQALEGEVLVLEVQEQRRGQIRHPLHVRDVHAVETVRRQNVLERRVQLPALAKELVLVVGAPQVLHNHVHRLFVQGVIAAPAGQVHSLQKNRVEIRRDFQSVVDEARPKLGACLFGYPLLDVLLKLWLLVERRSI